MTTNWKQKDKLNKTKMNWKLNKSEAKQDENENEMNFPIYGIHGLTI